MKAFEIDGRSYKARNITDAKLFHSRWAEAVNGLPMPSVYKWRGCVLTVWDTIDNPRETAGYSIIWADSDDGQKVGANFVYGDYLEALGAGILHIAQTYPEAADANAESLPGWMGDRLRAMVARQATERQYVSA